MFALSIDIVPISIKTLLNVFGMSTLDSSTAFYAGSVTSDAERGAEGDRVLSIQAHSEHSGNGTSSCTTRRWGIR